jgi:hypothetical protein
MNFNLPHARHAGPRMLLLTALFFLVLPLSLLAQQQTISGQVTDARKTPLPAVTVLIKGTAHGTATDTSGRFTLKDVPPNSILVFSSTGFETQEIPLRNKGAALSITLQENSSGLNEVVVIGYGTLQKKDLTGSVSQIK